MELNELLSQTGIDLTDRQLEQFDIYCRLLQEWNEKFNLTAITDDEGIYVRHFYDSLLLGSFELSGSLCDVGSGAGFPGIPLKIAYPQLEVYLIEPTGKRCTFLQEVISQLGLENIHVINARSEDYKDRQFDFVCARAVAPLNILAELCLPLVKTCGHFLPAKGPGAFSELTEAEKAIRILGGRVEEVRKFTLPDDSQRIIIDIFKEKDTPKGYPRAYSRIKRKPL